MANNSRHTFRFNQKFQHRLMFLVLVSAGVVLIGMGETGYNWAVDFTNTCSQLGSAQAVQSTLSNLQIRIILGTLVGLAALTLIIIFISGLVVKPVLALTAGVEEIIDGNYAHRVEESSPDEIGYLSRQFNKMAQGLEEREFLRDTFGRFVSPELAKKVLDSKLSLGGETKRAVVLFTDLRGFTTFSEPLSPQEVVRYLNDYFTMMHACIERNGGWINKYLGDGMLVLFDAPVQISNPAQSALQATFEMNDALAEFNKQHGTSLRMGAGIHYGEVVIGNIGSSDRMEYTCIGDPVNTAARIEELTALYKTPVLMSSTFQSLLAEEGQQLAWTTIDRVRLRGKQDVLTLYTPLKEADSFGELSFREHEEFVEAYFTGEFEKASKLLAGKKLAPAQEVLLRRCFSFLKQPPVEWDGIYQSAAKAL